MAKGIRQGISTIGVSQEDLVNFLENVKDIVNELQADHATLIAFETGDAIINATALSTGSTAENVATTAFQYKIDGVTYTKAAVTAGTAFTDADTINTGAAAGIFWGAWILQINAAGTISTHAVGADQVYTTEAAAIAALPVADAGNVAIGYVTIAATEDADWVAKTDDVTDGSDNTSVTFYNTASNVPATLTNSTALTLDKNT